jgi:hypothetical protein
MIDSTKHVFAGVEIRDEIPSRRRQLEPGLQCSNLNDCIGDRVLTVPRHEFRPLDFGYAAGPLTNFWGSIWVVFELGDQQNAFSGVVFIISSDVKNFVTIH